MPTLRIHLSRTDPHNQACRNTNTAATVATHREVFHIDWKSKIMDQISYPGAEHADETGFKQSVSTQRETSCKKLALRFPK
jgi:hypothetical protein